jgi:hypothetical protein
MGMSGYIAETGHEFERYWCCCLLRNTNLSDFTTSPGQFTIWIAPQKLPVHPAPYPQKALFEWVAFKKTEFVLCGYGTVAESVNWIEEIFERTMNSRRRVKNESPD